MYPANYRHISLTSIACKLPVHIVHMSIMDHLDYSDLLSTLHHGLRIDRSCETQLALVVQDLESSVVSSCQTDAVILDFSEAFDTAFRKRLLYKAGC